MTPISATRRIAAAPERVFDAIADIPTAGRRLRSVTKVEMLTDPPVRVGTRWRETRTMFGRAATEEMTVAVLDRPYRLVFTSRNHGTDYQMTYLLAADDGGTRLEAQFGATPANLVSRILAFIARPLTRRLVGMLEADLADIAAAAETGD